MKEQPWVDVASKLPKIGEEVEILREDEKEEIGFYYRSRKTGVTWIGEDNHRIIYNPVIAWRYEVHNK